MESGFQPPLVTILKEVTLPLTHHQTQSSQNGHTNGKQYMFYLNIDNCRGAKWLMC